MVNNNKNSVLSNLIIELSILGTKSKAWKRIASDLKRPTRIQRKVNIDCIEKYAKDKLTVVIPGKVLGIGNLTKKVDVVAYSFSETAITKITNAGGKAIFLSKYIKKNTEGKGIQILG